MPCDPSASGACLAQLRQFGLLGSVAEAACIDGDALMIAAGGSLDCTWYDASGVGHA